MQDFLRFRPLPQERVWGGRALETALGRALPPGGRPFGESWEIVDRPEAQSVVVGGQFAGLTLRELLVQHSAAVMGPRWPAGKPFPILVKWLDCRERLSLQVHPPAAVAARLGGEPKTENWFVAAAAPGAHLIVGLRPGVTREQFEAAVAAGTAEACVNRFPVVAGDSVLVRSGLVHAIDGGNLILEIQQNSDTTYRVDDWGRVGLDGQPRQLHLAESLQSILWDAAPPWLRKSSREQRLFGLNVEAAPYEVLAKTVEFGIVRARLAAGKKLRFFAGQQPQILSVIEGRLTTASGEVGRGENIVLPFAGKFVFTAAEDSLVLVTGGFAPGGGFYAANRRFEELMQSLFVLVTGKRGDELRVFTDRMLLRMSMAALLLSTLSAACMTFAFHALFYFWVLAFTYGSIASPSCLVMAIWELIRGRRTRRTLLAAGVGVLGTAVSWAAFYFHALGQWP